MEGVDAAMKKEPSAGPVETPRSPAPAESGPGTDAETKTPSEIWSTAPKTPPRVKTGPNSNGIAVDHRGIVYGHVNNLRPRGLNDDALILIGHGLLRRGAEISRGLRFLPHELDCVQHIGLLILIGVAQRLRPRKILVHIGKHGRELRERFHAGVPIFLIDFCRQVSAFQIGIGLKKVLGVFDFVWIRGAGQDLRHERVGIKRDGRHCLL